MQMHKKWGQATLLTEEAIVPLAPAVPRSMPSFMRTVLRSCACGRCLGYEENLYLHSLSGSTWFDSWPFTVRGFWCTRF